jgi:hypothetical protein
LVLGVTNGLILYGGDDRAGAFDFMSDTLRGMRGIMLDMLRNPEELLAAEEKALEIQLERVLKTPTTSRGLCEKLPGPAVSGRPRPRARRGFASGTAKRIPQARLYEHRAAVDR